MIRAENHIADNYIADNHQADNYIQGVPRNMAVGE